MRAIIEEVMRRKREKPAKAMACMAANVALVEKGRAAYLYTRWGRSRWGRSRWRSGRLGADCANWRPRYIFFRVKLKSWTRVADLKTFPV